MLTVGDSVETVPGAGPRSALPEPTRLAPKGEPPADPSGDGPSSQSYSGTFSGFRPAREDGVVAVVHRAGTVRL